MARKKEATYVDELILRRAENDLNSIPKSKTSLRLLAIISAGRGKTILEISEFFRVTRQSVYFWITKYKKEGLSGLYDRPKGHPKKRLSPRQEKEIIEWLSSGKSVDGEPIHWTIDKLKAAIEEEYRVILSRSRVGALLQEWGFRPKVPRPKHARSDEIKQEAFKKTSQKDKRDS